MLEEINEILDYSKLESGRMTFENENFNLRHLADTLKAILENEVEQRNLNFVIEIDESVPEYVYGDPLKLKQVLTNLIYNGFKFTKEGGVTLSIKSLHFSTKQCVLEFSVKDTGIGVKKEQRQKIFDAFAQADASLIVYDNKVNRILEAEVLHKFGYIADTEGDPEAVIDRMHRTAYDIVFLDISMPKISGYELSIQIRKMQHFKILLLLH